MAKDVCIVVVQEGKDLDRRELLEAAQGVALLKENGVRTEAMLVRSERQRKKAAARILGAPPAILMLVLGKNQVSPGLALVEALQPIPPKTTLVIGGSYGTLCCYEFTKKPHVNAIALGVWLESLRDLAEAWLNGKTGSDISGLWWRGEGGWDLSRRRTYAPDLDHWPDPDWEEFRLQDILKINGRSFPIHASRGYPFMSLFWAEPLLRNLQISSSSYWIRPPERVVEEAVAMREKHDLASFEFVDEIFPWDAEWREKFGGLWSSKVGLPFRIRTVSEHMKRPLLSPLKRAGLEDLDLYLETGNDVLRARLADMNRTNPLVREVLGRCERMEIRSHAHFYLNVPQETKETLADTVRLSRECGAWSVDAQVFIPWPRSPDWTELEKSFTGATVPMLEVESRQSKLNDEALKSLQKIQLFDSVQKIKRIPVREHHRLNLLTDFKEAQVRSPLPGCVQVTSYYRHRDEFQVVSARVPTSISWMTEIPEEPILDFGVMLSPKLPGERSRQPISLSVKATQNERTFRLFQKVAIQALDPDSRNWRSFRIPLTVLRPGPAELIFEAAVYGQVGDFLPPDCEIWAGWTGFLIQGTAKTRQSLESEVLIEFED